MGEADETGFINIRTFFLFQKFTRFLFSNMMVVIFIIDDGDLRPLDMEFLDLGHVCPGLRNAINLNSVLHSGQCVASSLMSIFWQAAQLPPRSP